VIVFSRPVLGAAASASGTAEFAAPDRFAMSAVVRPSRETALTSAAFDTRVLDHLDVAARPRA